MGMIENYADTSSKMSKNEWTKPMHNLNRPENVTVESTGERANLFSSVLTQAIIKPYPWWHPKYLGAWLTNNIQLALQSFDYDVHKSAWADVANAAEEFNEPGKFTTFIGYEFTASTQVEGGNLHRNVIFNSSKAPIRPWTRIDSLNPEDLWTWMDALRDKGVDSLAMPHNSNGSNGQMFEVETFRGNAIDKEYAEKRMRNEPVVEMTQVKGTSDTHPLLSPDDEWADFEIMDKRVGSRPPTYSMPQGGYVRDAYLRGLTLEWKNQGNPYKFGLIGSSDTHTGAGAFDEDNYWSKTGVLDGTDMGRGSVPLTQDRIDQLSQYAIDYDQPISIKEIDGRTYANVGFDQWGASGLAVAWAEENTRESIFQAHLVFHISTRCGDHIYFVKLHGTFGQFYSDYGLFGGVEFYDRALGLISEELHSDDFAAYFYFDRELAIFIGKGLLIITNDHGIGQWKFRFGVHDSPTNGLCQGLRVHGSC